MPHTSKRGCIGYSTVTQTVGLRTHMQQLKLEKLDRFVQCTIIISLVDISLTEENSHSQINLQGQNMKQLGSKIYFPL